MTPQALMPDVLGRETVLELVEMVTPSPTQARHAPILTGADGTQYELPEPLYDVLVSVVRELGQGNGVTIVPLHAELTTAEAAEILNVSRPHLVKLLEAGAIPFSKVGTHRRVRLQALLAYKGNQDQERQAALQELHDLGDEHDMPF